MSPRRIEVRPGVEAPAPITLSPSTTINGRHVERGQELTVRGMGRCRFIALATHDSGETWLDLVDRYGRLRSAQVDAVTTVHRIARTRENGA